MGDIATHQAIRYGDQHLVLPAGVNLAEWALERIRWQNPRIRAYLGSIRLLGEVLESNYAILHCSPDRLREIWRKVRRVSELIRSGIAPLLAQPSCIPALEEARQSAQMALIMLTDTVLADLDRFPAEIPPDQLLDLRKLLCVSIGQIHAFLHDTFGELMAHDPRSLHDADYFLSRRFPQDIEEAEWLQLTVLRLRDYVEDLLPKGVHLSALLKDLRREENLPSLDRWQATQDFLEKLLDELTPRLREVLALRGIRFSEMEILDRYTSDIPAQVRIAIELYDAARETLGALESAGSDETGLASFHTVFSRRLAARLAVVETSLRDLNAFVPLWLDGVDRRRALMLRKGADDSNDRHHPEGPQEQRPKTALEAS